MKKQLIYLLASACLLAAGCSTENKTDETGYGTLAINCTADTSIDTASAEASGTPEAPAAGAFSLTVTGETGTQKWDTLTEFEQSQTVFRMGAYTVAIAHGDPDAEGAGKPYYYAEQKIEVLPRRTVNADLTATVANSQVVIRATEQFLAYFHDARFTVTTASGNEFAFTPGSDPADEPVFVKGGTRLTVTGTARRQSPTGTGEGPEVTFSAQTLDATTPRTCHIITYDAKNAGSVPALRFTAEGTGYYTLPAGMTSLAWLFRGTHVEGKNVEMEDYIPNVKAGGKYTLTFKYSPDLPGYIDCVLISVDPGTDDKDDEIIFSPDPAVISEGFDIAEIQKYVSGEKKYRILAFSELTRFTVSVGDKSYDALNGTTEGISLEPVDKYNVRLTLSDAFFASCQAGDQKVTLRIEDANGGSSEVATTYRLEGLVPVTADDYDLWANTVTLRVVSFTPGTTVQFGLRSSGGEWQPMAGTSQGDDFITATYAPQWEEKTTADWSTPATVLPYSRLKEGTGISAGNTYDYKATVGSKELSGRFTAAEGTPMPDGSLESWRSAQQFPGSGTNYTFWGSGYNAFAKELCTRDEAMPGRVGTYCAKLSATYNTLAKVPAPGNLFTGDFAIQVLGGMGGNVSFGKKFAYNARPRAVRFKYHATIGEVNYNLHGGKIPVGEMDKARIFVCIVDWTAQQKVFAGTKAPTGTWDPETQTEAANGPIIGYASKFIEETTQGDEMVEVILPINYYQDTAAAPDGKYNIVVSCSTSAYGDYMDACTTNVMYVDDFEWVY